MKLYLITSPEYTIDKSGAFIAGKKRWAGTQVDARKARIEFEEPFKIIPVKQRPKVEIEEVEVPTDKQGLMAFLNNDCIPVK